MAEDLGRLSFLDGPFGTAFEKLVVVVAPGGSRGYAEAEWRDALVVVERGEIELETTAGCRQRFASGDILCLDGPSLRALHNRGGEDAILVTVPRRRGPTD